MDSFEASSFLNTTPFSAAVQITRPKSASKQGSSSPTKVKIAKLVLQPATTSKIHKNLAVNKTSPPKEKAKVPDGITTRSPTVFDNLCFNQNVRNAVDVEPLTKKYQQTDELEKKMRKVEKEKKALNAAVMESSSHKINALDESTRIQAREYMKKQREKRKLETKKEVDKSFVIKQRLDELRKTTRNVISKKPKKSQVKISPPKDYYSMSNIHMKEIKVLKLKPMSAKSQKSLETTLEDLNMKNTTALSSAKSEESMKLSLSPVKPQSPIKKPQVPFKGQSPIRKPQTPIKIPQSPLTKPPSPLRVPNRQFSSKPQQESRPSSAKENKRPIDDLKLKVPDVKLSMSALNRTEIVPPPYQPQQLPFWMQNSAVQPYPYNFIWAVRKKLEAYTSTEEAKRKNIKNFETPHVKKTSKAKPFRQFLSKQPQEDTKFELQRPTIADDSDTNANYASDVANTISEISSIKSDMAQIKSQSAEKEQKHDDDTTISESIFLSLKDDAFVGKKRESINSEFDRASFDKKIGKLELEYVSPNTTEKRVNFLKTSSDEIVTEQNNKLNQEKEEEYQKMLEAFNQSLSNVIQVNQMLSTVLTSKSTSVTSSTDPSGTVENYTSSFENNVESKTHKTSDISEMIENLVQRSQQAPAPPVEQQSDSNSSIKTFIEDSKPEIEDPPLIINEPAQELSSSTTKVTTEIVQQKVINELENTLNESNLMNMLKINEIETSFNITLADNNESFGMLMDKSASEIKSWERSLIDRTHGQVALLELQKQNFRKIGQLEKVSEIKKKQRGILLKLEKKRLQLRENSERSKVKKVKVFEEKNVEFSMNDSDAKGQIERILQEREEKINKRRIQVEHLVKWQQKLDREEEKLKLMEQELLGANMRKSTPSKKKFDDILDTSIGMVKSIDKSLKTLENIKPSEGEEVVEVTGDVLNKLWRRLTKEKTLKFEPEEKFEYSKEDFAKFYENAKEFVLQSDLKKLLECSVVPEIEVENSAEKKEEIEKLQEPQHEDFSDVSTMNSIANIETEEEYPGSFPVEPETPTTTTTENDDEIHQLMANQMKVFFDQKIPTQIEDTPVKDFSTQMVSPTIDNATFQVRPKTPPEDLNVTTSTVGENDMDIEPDSLIQTEPLLSIDNSSVDNDGSIIPESNEILFTDMDAEESPRHDPLIEDISFPDLEISISDEMAQQQNDSNRNDLSTITECTEYEQSQGSSSEEISSEIVSHTSTATTSERVGSEIEKRLISINDSLEEVNKVFEKITMINRSPSTVTYSTDKDFIASPKPSSSDSNEQNLLTFSPTDSESTMKESEIQMTTSTPKILMPDIISDVSEGKKTEENDSDDF